MEKLNHICKWNIEILSGPDLINENYNIKVRGICLACKKTITKEELEWRANVGEREYARQATYVKRED